VWFGNASPGANMLYLLQAVVVWMKLISYAHANRGLRRSSRKVKKIDMEDSKAAAASASSGSSGSSMPPSPAAVSRQSSVDDLYSDNNAKPYNDQVALLLAECKDLEAPFLMYPQNITTLNLLYFMVAPTLCYQLNYPRTPSIRWMKVLFILLRMLFVAVIIIFAVEQYITPTLETVLAPMEERDVLMVIERLLKLSIPNTYVWLLGFYLYFHLWMNLLAELTRFGDRLFYKEWWNARTIDEYWRTWNMPVHHWVTRHLCKYYSSSNQQHPIYNLFYLCLQIFP
jgi:diacylglycerol O-acyltransferase-1